MIAFRNWFCLFLLLCSLMVVSCGDDEKEAERDIAITVKGLIGGCQVTGEQPDIVVGLFGEDSSGDKKELASSSRLAAGATTWEFRVTEEPSDDYKTVMIGNANRIAFTFHAYIDIGSDGWVNEEFVGTGRTTVFYYDMDVPTDNILKGYNLASESGTEAFDQDFDGLTEVITTVCPSGDDDDDDNDDSGDN